MTHPLYTACLIAILPLGVGAETFDIKMLNKGEAGRMIFEPDHVSARVGDTLRFIATDRGHNAETIDGMLPTDATPFAGRINEEIEVTLTQPGYYGIMCKPHYAMGMVMIVAVGDGIAPDPDFLAGRIPPKAKARLAAQLAAVQQ